MHINKRSVVPDSVVIAISSLSQTQSSTPEIDIYPNPATNNSVTIEYIDTNSDAAQLNIFNLQGRKMYSGTIFNNSKSIIDTRAFVKGIYIVNVKNGNASFIRKLVVE